MKITLRTLLMLSGMVFVLAHAAYAPVAPPPDAPEIPAGLAPYFLAGLTGGAFLIRRYFNRGQGS